MATAELNFESGENGLNVLRFSTEEGVSELFQLSISARSVKHDIDLELIVGRAAGLRIDCGKKFVRHGRRQFSGLCSHIELVASEAVSGGVTLALYELTIVPRLWLLTQRNNYRVFQHQTVPEIVRELLSPWDVAAQWKCDESQ